MTAWRRRRRARFAPRDMRPDPDNDERKLQALAQMSAFDRLGPQARRAIRESRFDAPAPVVMRKYGGPFAEDERVADRVRDDDNTYSGMFGPRYPKGI
jgi:hypothetical protein